MLANERVVLQSGFFQRDAQSRKFRVKLLLIGAHPGKGDDDPLEGFGKGEGDRVEGGLRETIVLVAYGPQGGHLLRPPGIERGIDLEGRGPEVERLVRES